MSLRLPFHPTPSVYVVDVMPSHPLSQGSPSLRKHLRQSNRGDKHEHGRKDPVLTQLALLQGRTEGAVWQCAIC